MDAAMKDDRFAETQGYEIPKHNAHDIYLNDVRKTKPRIESRDAAGSRKRKENIS
jgi:hypothetical protein